MLKRILISVLASLATSFLTNFGFFYVFSEGGIADFSNKFETVLRFTSFWIGFAVWSALFFVVFFLPFSLLLTKKELNS